MGILIPLIIIFITCVIIWRACDGFEIASEYAGRNLTEGVRGGTINAISSSLPELLTTLIALFVLADSDGFAIGIGTTAGSALFNGMIIPASCILVAVFLVTAARRVKSVDVSPKVILRDGLFLIAAEIVLIVILNGNSLDWWQGAILVTFYLLYIFYMFGSMRKKQCNSADSHASEDADDSGNDDTEESGEEKQRTMVGHFL